MGTFDFREQLGIGEKYEKQLDAYFSHWAAICHATRRQQRAGIDRVFVAPGGNEVRVEYKTDLRASQTGNAFIETVSVSNASTRKPGWAYTSQADVIIYYIPGDLLAYVLRPSAIRNQLERWSQKYREVAVQNHGYATRGLLVPLAELEEIAEEVISL